MGIISTVSAHHSADYITRASITNPHIPLNNHLAPENSPLEPRTMLHPASSTAIFGMLDILFTTFGLLNIFACYTGYV